MKLQNLILAVLVGLALLVGCKKDDNPVTPPVTGGTTTIIGSLAGSAGGTAQSGAINLTFATPKRLATAGDTLNVSGKLYMSTGDTVTLTGIYVVSTGYLSVSGGGYTITGTLTSGHLTAAYTGPGGASGSVVGSTSGSGHTVTAYCGHYQELTGGEGSGTFNMVVDGTSITLITSDGNTFYGTVSGANVTIYLAGTSGTVLATGTIDGTHASGTYDTPDAVHGDWSADVCQ